MATCTRLMHSGSSPILQQNSRGTPHDTTQDHTTSPRHHTTYRRLAAQRQGQRAAAEAASCSAGVRRHHHPTPAAIVLCRGIASQFPRTGRYTSCALAGVLVVVAGHGLVVDPQSAVWPPSTFTNDACPCPRLCTSTV